MAYYYQEYILGLPAPQPVPMTDVVIALDLSGEGTISDYKKLLQGLIWKERGHPRELAEFLLSNGLLTPVDLELARRAAVANERTGKSELARQRLRYRMRKKTRRGEPAGMRIGGRAPGGPGRRIRPPRARPARGSSRVLYKLVETRGWTRPGMLCERQSWKAFSSTPATAR